ncbi:hypothetical protein BGX27_002219 [Mortierella sp. AM989]|nr:hypothetical protein BGX27_002219 [Mortierella sp. AM989]
MEELIPDLTHYAQGLGPSTFPLKINVPANARESHSVCFTIVTLEGCTCLIDMNGQGFRVKSYSSQDLNDSTLLLPSVPAELPFSARQQEALSGVVYETIEGLLMALSPGFEEFFGQELSRKLSAISWDRLREQGDIDDADGDWNITQYNVLELGGDSKMFIIKTVNLIKTHILVTLGVSPNANLEAEFENMSDKTVKVRLDFSYNARDFGPGGGRGNVTYFRLETDFLSPGETGRFSDTVDLTSAFTMHATGFHCLLDVVEQLQDGTEVIVIKKENREVLFEDMGSSWHGFYSDSDSEDMGSSRQDSDLE